MVVNAVAMASNAPAPNDATRSDATPSDVFVAEGDGDRPASLDRPEPTFPGQPAKRRRTITMPDLGLGTWELDGDTAEKMVRAALDLGVRHIDTAQMYGNEDAVGRAIAASGVDRDDLFVTTKIGNDNHEPDRVAASLRDSLAELQLDHVDLTLVHWPVEFDRMPATLDTLAQAQAAGLTRHLGVSNFTIEQLDQVHHLAPLEVLQVECHPYLQQRELRQWAVDHQWLLTAYSPIAQGDVFDDDVLADIAAAHSEDERQVSPVQVALAFLRSLDNVVAIPRTSDPDHLAANWASLEVELTADEIARIEALDAGRRLVDPTFAPW